MRSRIVCTLAVLLAVMLTPAHSANTHGTSDTQGELQAFFGDGFTPYVKSGCLPVVPSSSLTFAAFACQAYARGASADLVYVTQSAISLTVTSTAGLHWIALHRDTSSAVAGWTRRAGSHYLFQQAATQPADPTGGLVVARVTVAGSVITAVQSTRPSRSPVSAALTLINVQDYGADPDDPGDDTASILAAIAALPTADAIALTQGSGCIYFPLPRTIGGFYKISSTLDLTEKWNGCMMSPAILTRGRNTVDPGRGALLKWYGPVDSDVIRFHNQISFDFTNISIDCRNIAGTVGLAFGQRAVAASVVKLVRVHHFEAHSCDMGIRHGNIAANGADVASNTFDDLYIHDNLTHGFGQYSGNGLINGRAWLFEHNGYAPTGGRDGANIKLEGGTLNLTGYESVQDVAYVQPPTVGDIVLDSAGISITKAWSEVSTPFIVSRGASAQGSTVSGSKHYTALMTDTTTPKSIVWESDNPLTLNGNYLFSNVEVNAGQNPLVVDLGTRFYAGAQHTLGVLPTFTGTAMASPFYSFGYAGFPANAQRGRVVVGLPPRTDLGATIPAIEATGREQQTMTAYCTQDVNGDGCVTIGYQRGGTNGVGKTHTIGNGYFDTGVIKSQGTGRMSYFYTSGGDSALGQPGIGLETDLASGVGQTKFAGGADHKRVFKVEYTATGTGTAPVLRIGTQSIGWASAAPTLSAWVLGDIFYNNNPVSGQPEGWRCTASGTPGTWTVMGNHP